MTLPGSRATGTLGISLDEIEAKDASRHKIRAVQRRDARSYPIGLILSLAFMAFLLVITLAPQLLTRFDPLVGDFLAGLKPPGPEHIFGTDRLGRDVFARTIYGARYSLLIGLGGMFISLLAGVILGIAAASRSRILDEFISRIFDVLSSFPNVLLAMLVVTFLGQGMVNVSIAVGIAGIPKFGRIVRAQTQLVRHMDYVVQAPIYGLAHWQVFLRHVLPNVLVAVPVIATVYIGSTILVVSGLSFLGLGPQPPTPEWGVMLAESRDVLRVAWWPGVFPGLAITLTVIAFTIVGRFLQKKFEGRVA